MRIPLIPGKIAFWFAEHNTPNPLFSIPSSVPVLLEDKFESQQRECRSTSTDLWEFGTFADISDLTEEADFIESLYQEAIGFMVDDLARVGIRSYHDLVQANAHDKTGAVVDMLDNSIYPVHTKDFILGKLRQIITNLMWSPEVYKSNEHI
jgi:hypothetical protein